MKSIKGNNYYTISDIQKEMGLPYQTIYKWIKASSFPTVKILNREYYTEKTFLDITKIG